MGDAAKRRATYADLLAVPDRFVAEIINGTLITQPRPASLHARATSRLGAELDGPFDRAKGGPGGWILLDEPELHLHADILVPDLAGWRRERMPELPDAAAFELAPDWVCEVLSPFRLDGGRWVLLGTWREDAKVRVEPFEVFELELAGLWAK